MRNSWLIVCEPGAGRTTVTPLYGKVYTCNEQVSPPAKGVYANRSKKLTDTQVADAAQKRQDGASGSDLARGQTLYTALKNV